MWLEIVLCLVLAPILEIGITVIAEKINIKRKGSPHYKEGNEAIENADPESFVVRLNNDVRGAVLLGIVCFGLLMLVGLVLYPVIYIQGQMTLTDFVMVSVVYNLVCAPFLFLLIKAYGRKIYINQETLTVKALLTIKSVKIDKVTKVISKAYENQNNDFLVVFVGDKKFVKITRSNINYAKADEMFSQLNGYEKIKKY